MSPPAAKSPYAGHRSPAEVIGHAVWLYFRFPLSLRMFEEMLTELHPVSLDTHLSDRRPAW
jgi:transposase-like protein